MVSDNIVDLIRRLRDRRAAEFKAQLDGAVQAVKDFEQALGALVDVAHSRGTPIYYVARALRECEEFVQDRAGQMRGHRRLGPKSKASWGMIKKNPSNKPAPPRGDGTSSRAVSGKPNASPTFRCRAPTSRS